MARHERRFGRSNGPCSIASTRTSTTYGASIPHASTTSGASVTSTSSTSGACITHTSTSLEDADMLRGCFGHYCQIVATVIHAWTKTYGLCTCLFSGLLVFLAFLLALDPLAIHQAIPMHQAIIVLKPDIGHIELAREPKASRNARRTRER